MAVGICIFSGEDGSGIHSRYNMKEGCRNGDDAICSTVEKKAAAEVRARQASPRTWHCYAIALNSWLTASHASLFFR